MEVHLQQAAAITRSLKIVPFLILFAEDTLGIIENI